MSETTAVCYSVKTTIYIGTKSECIIWDSFNKSKEVALEYKEIQESIGGKPKKPWGEFTVEMIPLYSESDLLEAGFVKHPGPTIVCLCGSTRFSEAFRAANLNETLKGNIVLTIGCDFKSDDALHLTRDDKIFLDNLHKRKIDIADEVLILNVDGYIGESTRSELEYAKQLNKKIRYLEPNCGSEIIQKGDEG